MGTTGIYKSMTETKKMILQDMEYTNASGTVSKVVSSSPGKGGMWILRKITKPDSEFFYIDFVKMEHKAGMTYYKEIGYDIHPYFYDCPLNWLNKIPAPIENSAKEWIENVKKHHSFNLVRGMTFEHDSRNWVTCVEWTKKFWTVQRDDGKVFKMNKEMLFDYFLQGKLNSPLTEQ